MGYSKKDREVSLQSYSTLVVRLFFVLLALLLGTFSTLQASVRINELMASNSSGLTDSNGEYCDWIELYNEGSQPVDLGGYYLSDDRENLQKWQFPSPQWIPAKGYLLVYADDTNAPLPVNGELHANFNLSKSGEYLALVDKDGVTVLQDFSPAYPVQKNDVSYGYSQRVGMDPEKMYFFEVPTPGRINVTTPLERQISNVIFSHPHGYREEPFTLELLAEEGAQIRYTLDGSTPSASTGTPYSGPLNINATSVLRAIAYRTGFVSSDVTTCSWIFLKDVFNQSSSPPKGWPASFAVNNQRMYYGMNPTIVQGSLYVKRLSQGFKDIQTISLSTDLKNLFNSQTGIYVNPSGSGLSWERPVSVELIDPAGGAGFQINAGLRIRGGFSRTTDNPKHSLKLYFRGRYGESALKYPLFGSEGCDEFSKVDLRTAQNYSWACTGTDNCSFVREVFSRDLQGEVNTPYTRSRHYHLFINGIYWGLYQTQERVDAHYAESYLGGEKEDWDCIHTGSAVDGNMDAYKELYNITAQGYSGDFKSNYYRVKGLNPDGTRNLNYPILLDEDNLIKLMINVYYVADWDSPYSLFGSGPNNLFAIYNRANPDGFKWFRHDAEHSLGVNTAVDYDLTQQGWNRTGLAQFEPMMLHQKLTENVEYKMRFADLVQEQFFNEGVLTSQKCAARFRSRMNEIDNAVVAESARWGATWGTLRTRETWLNVCNNLFNSYFPQRSDIVLKQFKKQGWYPAINPPASTVPSGEVVEGQAFSLSADTPFYYTTDGTDPRLPGGGVHPQAIRVPSGVNEGEFTQPQIFISKESNWKYFDQGTFPPPQSTLSWRSVNYDDSAWKNGKARLGFGTRVAVNTTTSSTNSTGGGITSTYFRRDFNVESLNGIGGLKLLMNRDDGAVVYLNGAEVLRSNMPEGNIVYSTLASENISSPHEDEFFEFEISSQRLRVGKNVLCAEVHQSTTASSDLYFDLELCGVSSSSTSEKVTTTLEVNANQTIFARSCYGGVWSAANRYTYRIRQNYDALKISEMMYSPELLEGDPYVRDDYGWLEIYNSGTEAVNMQDVRFSEGISYTFPGIDIPAGGYLVLAKNADAFIQRYYSGGIILLSGYEGNLARKGETLTLLTPEDKVIQTVIYSNGEFPNTDRKGYSLECTSPVDGTYPLDWRSSLLKGGTPGFASSTEGGPQGQVVMSGERVEFVFEGVEDGLPIQWLSWDSTLSTWVFKKDSLSNRLEWGKVSPEDAGLYRAQYEREGVIFPCMPFELAVVQSELQDQVIEESTSGCLEATVSTGSPEKFRWQKCTLDGVWGDISGGVGTTLQIPYARKSDAGNYRIICGNSWASNPVTLSVSEDTRPPTILEVTCASATTLVIRFSEYVTIESALNLSNYYLDNQAQVLGVTTDPQSRIPDGAIKLYLQTTPLSAGYVYQLTVRGICDISSNSNQLVTESRYFQMGLQQGVLRQVWYNCDSTLGSLTNKSTYPNKPDFTEYISEFSTPVNWSDYYGQRLSGYVIPPVTGRYTFWIASDDYSNLYLSTDNTPANKRRIAYVEDWTSDREWTKFASQKSTPIQLVANTPYFIEAIQAEGSGGDHLAVRWQLPSGAIEEPLGGERLYPADGEGNGSFVLAEPKIISNPASLVCTEGEPAQFEVWVQSSIPLTYTWEVNGVVQTNQVGRVFRIESVSLDQDGVQIRCRVRNFAGTQVSAPATLEVRAAHPEPPQLRVFYDESTSIRIEFEGRLQTASSLDSPVWVDVEGTSPVEVRITEGMQFFRALR